MPQFEEVGLSIGMRNIDLEPQWRRALVSEGGKGQAPCLKIEQSSQDAVWLRGLGVEPAVCK